MCHEMDQMPTLEEFLAEIRIYTKHPHIAAALEAVKNNGPKKIHVEIGDVKFYSVITPK